MSQNPFTLTAFADWIDQARDPQEHYEWAYAGTCACGQYAEYLGVPGWTAHASNKFWFTANDLAEQRPRNFGALSKRLRRVAEA